MERLDAANLPDDVNAAHQRATTWIAERFRGRRIVPQPIVMSMPIVEEGDAVLYAILVLPTGEARERINRASVAVSAAHEKNPGGFFQAVQDLQSLIAVEMIYWVQGQPDDSGKDSRVVARDYLRQLRTEVGSLGEAMGTFANAAMEVLNSPKVTLGKL